MAILLVDAGSTKTEWTVLGKGVCLHSELTSGINPNYISTEEIKVLFQQFVDSLPAGVRDALTEVHYYGTGCARVVGADKIRQIVRQFFPAAALEVASDLKAAAVALLQKESGVAAILGTGAAVCFYDGSEVVKVAPSAGWLLGDEGSGTYLGKQLLAAYLNGRLPAGVRTVLETECGLDEALVLQKVYRETAPNRWIATFARFVEKHLDEVCLQELCERAFCLFLSNIKFYFPDYQKYSVNILGSVGFHFQDIIRRCAEQEKVQLGEFAASPMPGLMRFYQNQK